MSGKRNDSSSSCNVSGFAMENSVVSNEHSKCDADIHMETPESKVDQLNTIRSVQSALGLCTMDEKWRNSELSVHSMMVTEEEKYNYMGSSNSICKEEIKSKRKNPLILYKNNHGLSSTSCINTEAVEGSQETNVKEDFQGFSNACVYVPRHSRTVKNKVAKKQRNFSKTTLSGKSVSSSDVGKVIVSDLKGPKKKSKNSAKQGLVLDVAFLHDADNKKRSGKTGKSDHTSSNNGGHTSSNNGGPKSSSPGSDNKNRLSPSVFIIPSSPSPSCRSDDGGGSETSSVYHSSYFTPSDEYKGSDGVSVGIQQDVFNKKFNKMALSPATPPLRTQSAMGSTESKELLSFPDNHKTQRRASYVADDVFRTSLPYIPSGSTLPESEVKSVKTVDIQPYEMRDPDLLCVPGFGNVCGVTENVQKDINDQTCRSNFGIVLSALCFILFLWYLGMVYSRFINKALQFDAFETLLTSAEPEIIQEVVINISANDFKLLPHYSNKFQQE